MNDTPRDRPYATEMATADVAGCRIERIYVKDQEQVEIRFSWWRDGRMMMRPLDLPEDELLVLVERAIANRVFSAGFLRDLLGLLADRAEFRAAGDDRHISAC